MKKAIIIIISLVVLGGVIFVLSKDNSLLDVSKTNEKEKAPAFSLEDYDGNTVSLADFKGKNLVINSWAAWCPFCRKELTDFAEVQIELGDEVTFIAVDRAESLETSKRYSDELGVTDDMIFLLNPSDSFYSSIGGFSMPETIFVDTEGNIVDHKRGSMDKKEVKEKIEQVFSL